MYLRYLYLLSSIPLGINKLCTLCESALLMLWSRNGDGTLSMQSLSSSNGLVVSDLLQDVNVKVMETAIRNRCLIQFILCLTLHNFETLHFVWHREFFVLIPALSLQLMRREARSNI